MFTLEVYSSIVFGGIIRCREAQSSVGFPTEVDDEYITEEGIGSQPVDNPSWLVGWNFTTTLYKVLEHAIDQLRDRNQQLNAPSFGTSSTPPIHASTFLDFITTSYTQLPDIFKNTSPFSGVPSADRFSFQTTNIIITCYTLRMVVLCSIHEPGKGRAAQIRVSADLLSAVQSIPIAYLQAISSPLVSSSHTQARFLLSD